MILCPSCGTPALRPEIFGINMCRCARMRCTQWTVIFKLGSDREWLRWEADEFHVSTGAGPGRWLEEPVSREKAEARLAAATQDAACELVLDS